MIEPPGSADGGPAGDRLIRDGSAIELPASLFLLPVGPAVAWRIHRADQDPLYYGRSAHYRFDDPLRTFGVLYCAQDTAGAFVETVLRQRPGRKAMVSNAYLATRKLSRIQ